MTAFSPERQAVVLSRQTANQYPILQIPCPVGTGREVALLPNNRGPSRRLAASGRSFF